MRDCTAVKGNAVADALKVLVCDDSAKVADMLDEYAKRLGAELGIPVSVQRFSDGAQLIEQYRGGADILLVDVEMPLLDGIEATQALRGFDQKICIVFVTSFEQYAISGYRVGAYRYMVKPVAYNQFKDELAEAFAREWQNRRKLITVKTKEGLVRLEAHDVMYVETLRNHRVMLRCLGREVDASSSIATLEGQLEGRSFFRVHRAFLVNLAHARGYGAQSVTMADGVEVPLSKYKRREFKEAFARYMAESTLSPASRR